MATSREERLAELRDRASRIDYPDIASAEELARSEDARAARHFGFAQPVQRTSLKMRFTGDGVSGHDLPGSVAGEVVGGLTAAVEAAATDRKLPPTQAGLYLSPVVLAGSTILELFAKPNEQSLQENLDTEIDDSPADQALAHLFGLLDLMNGTPLGQIPSAELTIGTRFGQKLFALSGSLIESEIDLELSWTRPRGRTRDADFSRNTASGFRALLDKETVRIETITETGKLETISTDGTIEFSYGKTSAKIDGSGVEPEMLRSMWAQTVEVTWTETTTSHARRAQSSTNRVATAIRRV